MMSRSDEAQAFGLVHCLPSPVHVELPVDRAKVRLHGVQGDIEAARDLGAAERRGEVAHDLLLARAEDEVTSGGPARLEDAAGERHHAGTRYSLHEALGRRPRLDEEPDDTHGLRPLQHPGSLPHTLAPGAAFVLEDRRPKIALEAVTRRRGRALPSLQHAPRTVEVVAGDR